LKSGYNVGCHYCALEWNPSKADTIVICFFVRYKYVLTQGHLHTCINVMRACDMQLVPIYKLRAHKYVGVETDRQPAAI